MSRNADSILLLRYFYLVQENTSTDSCNACDVSGKNPASLHTVAVITVLVLWHSNCISPLFD